MALARITVWTAGQVLTAAALNTEFNNILDNAGLLVSPWPSSNFDLNGSTLIFDADADTSMDSFVNDTLDITIAGADDFRFTANQLDLLSGSNLLITAGTLTVTDGRTILADPDARTTTVAVPVTVRASTTGAQAVGIGTGMLFQAESNDEDPADFGQAEFAASDVTANTEDTYFQIRARTGGTQLKEYYRWAATDSYAVPFDQVWRVSSGGVFVDETTDANSAAANDWQFFPAGAGLNDYAAVGSTYQFSGIQINVGTAGTGTYTVTWQYWNGTAWTALAGVVDGTTNFKTAGTNTITYTIPTNWASNTLNAVLAYYIRAIRDAGTVTLDPLGTQGFVRQARLAAFTHGNTADRTYTLQNSSDTIGGRATTDTFTNKQFGAAPDTPTANIAYSDSLVRGWVIFNIAGTIDADFNVSSITDNGFGDWTINWATPFATANYVVSLTLQAAIIVGSQVDEMSGPFFAVAHGTNPTISALRTNCWKVDGVPSAVLTDPTGTRVRMYVTATGLQ